MHRSIEHGRRTVHSQLVRLPRRAVDFGKVDFDKLWLEIFAIQVNGCNRLQLSAASKQDLDAAFPRSSEAPSLGKAHGHFRQKSARFSRRVDRPPAKNCAWLIPDRLYRRNQTIAPSRGGPKDARFKPTAQLNCDCAICFVARGFPIG